MPAKTPSIISSVVTVILLIAVSLFLSFMTLVLLNGFGEKQANPALITSFACQGVTLIVAAILASYLTKTFITRFSWNHILAVSTSVLVSVIFGSGSGFISMIISAAVAEGLRTR